MLSETLLVLIINNSFLLTGTAIKYLADSNCTKFICCRGALEIDELKHLNSEGKKEADATIEQMGSMVSHPMPLGEAKSNINK